MGLTLLDILIPIIKCMKNYQKNYFYHVRKNNDTVNHVNKEYTIDPGKKLSGKKHLILNNLPVVNTRLISLFQTNFYLVSF